jgi:glutaconate CoA-transferase, subunit B
MMTAATARELKHGAVSFVGIGWPTEATNPARATHVPDYVLIYESGTLGASPLSSRSLPGMGCWRGARKPRLR